MSAALQIAVRQATDPQASAWVGANAGAGKTYILVSRLVRLMLDGVAPEKLLCLTYTRSAAAEMQERLFDLLGSWALMEDEKLRRAIAARLGDDIALDDLAKARVLFARALETPGGLRVQTIHAFCESLLKRFPLEAGLSPQFDLMDEQDMQDMHFDLISALIRKPESDRLAAAMALLSRALSEPDLVHLGRLVLDRRMAFDGLDAEAHLQDLARQMNLTDGTRAVPTKNTIIDAAQKAVAPHAAALADWLAGGSPTDRQRGLDLLAWRARLKKPANETAAADEAWPLLEAIFLTEGRRRKRLATKAISEGAPDRAQEMSDAADYVERAAGLLRARATYDLTAALLDFAVALTTHYAAAKAARAMLDYDDLIATTNHLLTGHRAAQWVLFKIDSGLEHILVDEAQDTSPAQWRLIRALADEFFSGDTGRDVVRTLFAVGDEKQSIFSFQGADPREFETQRTHFEKAVNAVGGRFHFVPLTLSWRSVPHILDVVDRLFADEATRQGVSLTRVTHSAHRADGIGHVELWPVERPRHDSPQIDLWDVPDAMPEDDAAARLAGRIGDKIDALLADKAQNIQAGDILILVRKRDGFVDEMIRALKRRHIQVAGADRMVLLDQIAIMDILAAADFALNHEDDLTLACVLKSPLCGIDEDALFALAHGRSASLWQAFDRAAESHPEFGAAHEQLQWMRRTIDYLSPFDWLSHLLAARGAHAALRAQLGSEIDDPVAELLRLALAYEARHVASMQGFLHWLRHGQQEIKRDMEARGGAVRIMTVHGAKGLEAPIVFLPDTCRAPVKSGGRQDAMQFDAHGLPLWRASKTLREAYGAQQIEAAGQAAAEEEKRLLYVALTRARDRLYIAGYVGRKSAKLPENCWYQRLSETFDAPPDMSDVHIWPGSQEAPLVSPYQAAQKPQPIAPPPPDWLAHAPDKAADIGYIGDKLFSPSGLAPVEEGARSPLHMAALQTLSDSESDAAQQADAMLDAAERGRLAHKLLESLPGLAAAEREAAALAFLARHPKPVENAADLVADVMRIIEAEDMAALFSPAARAEAPIAGFLTLADGRKLALSGQIDRYVETDEEILLVDFKTGHRPAAVPLGYQLQMAAYAALMAAAKKDKPVRCGLVWTRSGQIDWLAEGDLKAGLADIISGARKLA